MKSISDVTIWDVKMETLKSLSPSALLHTDSSWLPHVEQECCQLSVCIWEPGSPLSPSASLGPFKGPSSRTRGRPHILHRSPKQPFDFMPRTLHTRSKRLIQRTEEVRHSSSGCSSCPVLDHTTLGALWLSISINNQQFILLGCYRGRLEEDMGRWRRETCVQTICPLPCPGSHVFMYVVILPWYYSYWDMLQWYETYC